MILWVADRFGMPGHYYRIWLRLITVTGMQPQEFRVAKLSDSIKRTLLTKLGSRKAPTWVPDEKPAIVNQINSWIADLRPRAIVLASPESLAYLDMAPEHATLHNLRGSVYERHGIPIIVSLPISAWTAMVTQKDIGAANYGFESQETFSAARQAGEIHPEVETKAAENGADAHDFGRAFDGGADSGNDPLAGTASVRSPAGDSRAGNQRSPSGRSAPALPSAGTRFTYGRTIDGTVEASEDGISGGAARVQDSDGLRGERQVQQGTSRVDETSEGDAGEDSDSDHDGDDEAELPGSDAFAAGDGGDRDSGDHAGRSVRDAVDPADEEEDRFFYEPVLSPVGQFVLTNDMAKLSRILEQGRRSNGPLTPVLLRK